MSTVELRKNPIAVPELGPLKIQPEDWRMLVRHVKALCGTDAYWQTGQDTVFIIVDDGGTNRILLMPFSSRDDWGIPEAVKAFSKSIIAFGYARGISPLDREKAVDGDADAMSKINSLEPFTADVKLSVEIDKLVGRTIYYIIMNRNFEYEIYKTPIENLYGILQPVEEESEPSTEKASSQRKQSEERYAFECRSCDAKFKSISEARRHVESNRGHKIFRIER